MSRQIFVEGQQTETKQGQIEETEASELASSLIGSNEDQVTITADELQKLFDEWDAQGHTDLSVDSTLATRIEKYLAYQEQLDPLREKLAERIYKPYIYYSNCGSDCKWDIYVNEEYLGNILLYKTKKGQRVVALETFKTILSALGRKDVKYMNDSGNRDLYINVQAYILENGGEFRLVEEPFNYNIHITL